MTTKMKTSMTSIDIHVALEELQSLVGYWLDNLYVTGNLYLFKFQGKGELKRPLLLIEPGTRIHLTELRRDLPSPGPKTLQLRRLIKGTRVSAIRQHGMDRLIILDLKHATKEHPYQVIVELFGKKSNLIVIDTNANNRIIYANWYRKMRDRDVLPGKSFTLPPTRGKFLLDITLNDLMSITHPQNGDNVNADNQKASKTSKKNQEKNQPLVKALATQFGGGGSLAEEILARASVPKNFPVQKLTETQARSIMDAIQELNSIIKEKQWQPCITLENDVPISVDPFPFHSIIGTRTFFKTFNDALDKYFSELEQPYSKDLRKKEQEIAKWKNILQQQQQHVERLRKQHAQYQKRGDLLYAHYQEVSEIISVIQQARKKNIDWDTILEKLELGKKKGMKAAQLIEHVNPNTATIQLRLDDERITIDFRKSVAENADEFYAQAKKAQRKIEPALQKMNETLQKIEELKNQQQEIVKTANIVIKRRSREWYEKFHWIRTLSHDLLVIGGKDVKTNELLAKKYLEPNDLFFHADISGAPYTILKIPFQPKSIDELKDDIEEAAKLAAVFSKAWKAGYGTIDVYYVTPDQVSFSAPSGEYIPRGGVMIRGKRTYLKNVTLEWAIGLLLYPHHARIISGPPENIDKKTGIYVILNPGELKKGQCAKKIKAFFESQVEDEDKPKVRALDLNEIVEHVPGNSKIVKTIVNPDFYPLIGEHEEELRGLTTEEE